ncbi:hypothetical protein Sru01_36630 [Sphaerisporangium rufum]|uniref:TNT domain-containing protein n=1 Tax=Sphaerisporangium rufum TaxID=1381558 RepID=A0A919R2U4_9ACTN|nr:TNT domain-containing protein [Sphaerisporangium rufum]GII78681.1 hypothetical protein Sru01_36630 [Sphaerisporangium rufum]
MRNLRRRAPLAAAGLGIAALSLSAVPALAGTVTPDPARAVPAGAPPARPAVSAVSLGTAGSTAAGSTNAGSTIAGSTIAGSTVGGSTVGGSAAAGAAGPGVQAPARPAAAAGDGTRPVCTAPFINLDPRLGPKYLPKKGLLGRILKPYVPLGGLSPQRFLNRYWDFATNFYRFPPDAGFAHAGGYPNGKVLAAGMTLRAGEKLDRFGGEGGSFMAPLGMPFPQRALPPTNLDTNPQSPQYPCNYHQYEVIRDFAVDGGPAAPAFQQPGGGTQYHLVSRFIPEAPPVPEEVPVSWLIANGFLRRLN